MATAGITASAGMDEFLKLLTTQMQNQDPLDPIKGSDFTAQLAQFSTLEGVEKLNASFGDLLTLQQMTQGANLLGKTVVYDSDGKGTLSRGTVTGVGMQNNVLQLQVGGKSIPLSQVRSLSQGS